MLKMPLWWSTAFLIVLVTFLIHRSNGDDSYELSSLPGVDSYAGVRSVATSDDGLRLYASTLRARNASVFQYNLVTKTVVTPPITIAEMGNCLDAGVQSFTSTDYPITPNAIAVRGTVLFIAGRTPSTQIVAVNGTTFHLLVGAQRCSGNESRLANGSKTSASMKSAEYIAVDPRNGDVYFSQSNAVFQLLAGATSVSYYFGDEENAGDRTTEPSGPVHRLVARTSDPNQIFIDAVDKVMYVAEGGMGTVRSIQMETGNASVIIGQFQSSQWPPASCSLDSPCTSQEVSFAYVTSVALYRPQSVQQRWLFVGDFTGAVVYKMVLETNMVSVVAGRLLQFGLVNGDATVSRLFAIRSFAVSTSSLYIADGSLRRLELNDRPPKPNPVIPTTVVETTTNTVTGVVLIGGFVNPTVATQASRANVILSLSRCERAFGDLPPFSHLLQFGIGDDQDFRFFAGAVVGNIALVFGTLALNAVVVFVFARATNRTTLAAAATLKFPSLVSLPLLFVLGPTMSAGVSLMAYASGWLVAIGVVGFVASLIGFGMVSVYFIFFFEGHTDFEMLDKRYSGLVARMLNPVGEWLQTDLTGRMGMFFEDYLPSCWWFIVVELGMCVLSGVVEGIRPEEQLNCLVAIGLAAVLYTAFFVAIILWQPYTVRLVFYIRATIAALQMLSTFMSLAAVKLEDKDWEAAGVAMALGSLYLAGLDAFLSLCLAVRDMHAFAVSASSPTDQLSSSLKLHKESSSNDDEEELLTVHLLSNGSMTASAVVHVDEVGCGSMPQRQISSSSEEEDERRSRFTRENKHEILRKEIKGLMLSSDTGNLPGKPAVESAYRDALAQGDYFLDARRSSPLPLLAGYSGGVMRGASSSASVPTSRSPTSSPPPPPPETINSSFVGTSPSTSRPATQSSHTNASFKL